MGRSQPPKSITLQLKHPQISREQDTAQKSCADWNALLLWARKVRGPQFDSSTAMYHVDQNTDIAEYWQGVEASVESTQDTVQTSHAPMSIGGAPTFQPAGGRHMSPEGGTGLSQSGRPVRGVTTRR